MVIIAVLLMLAYPVCGAGHSVYGAVSDTLTLELTGEKRAKTTQIFADSLSAHQYIQAQLLQLQSEGFLLARVDSAAAQVGFRYVRIHTGSQFEWMEIREGNLSSQRHLIGLFDERLYRRTSINHGDISYFFGRVLDASQNRGYPFASIRLDSISRTGSQFAAAINYQPGPFITNDTLQVVGETKTQPLFLARLLRIIPGEPFSQAQIDRSLKTLRTLPYIQVAGEPTLTFQNEEATLYLPINDRRINTLDGIIGVLPNEIEGNRLLVTGQFELELYNVSGKGRNYKVSWQRLSQYSQNLRLSAREPMVLGSAIDINTSFFLLKEDTTFLNRDFTLELGYRISPVWSTHFFSRRQAGDLLSTAHLSGMPELPEAADFRFNSYGIEMEMVRLDDVFFPKRGSHAEFTMGVGNKRILQNTGLSPELYAGLEPRSIQYYAEAGYSRYFLWKQSFGAVVNMRAGHMDNTRLLLNDLFRLGGLRSIRGFNENHFFASQFAYANIEPRFYFDTSSYFLIFADVSTIENRVGNLGRDWPYSFGGGFRLQTVGGIFNFIYAVGKSATQPLGFNYSRIHFGYTGRF